MLIGIDGNEANTEKKVGVHQVAFELLWVWSKLQDKENSYVVYLKSPPRSDMPRETSSWKYKILPSKGLWVLTSLTKELWFGKRPDVFFTPTHYLPILSPVHEVCLITDLGYLEFSGQFTKKDFWQLKYWTAISLIVSKYIIAISESTKKDIVRHYKFASRKIKVSYLGPNKSVENISVSKNFVRQILKKYRITKKFIAFVSTLKPGKNIEGLIEAYSLMKNRSDYQLVIAGKKGWLFSSIFEKVKKLGLTEDVLFTDYVTEEEKKVLISEAEVFTLPSFWEGFGIDILNAFAVGTPVLTSKVASLPEVGGNAAIYVDPNDATSIRDGLEKVLNMDSKEYNERVKLGYRQLKKFSWEKFGKETLEVLKKATKNKHVF